MSENILLVDADKDIADLIEIYLKKENFIVLKYYDTKDTLGCIEKEKIDLVILDAGLFYSDGKTICEKIIENQNYPVLILHSKEEHNRVLDYNRETVDYLIKPFRSSDLTARVKSLIKRFTKRSKMNHAPKEHILMVSDLELNRETQVCTADERRIALTPTEFKILWILCRNRGSVVKAEQLFTEAWGENYYSGSRNSIMVHIRHLREKLDSFGEKGRYIKTVWGVGYKIDA